MLSRERLWQRISGKDFWPLPWALAAACAWPWMLPERWGGHLAHGWMVAGWIFILASGVLFWFRRLVAIPLILAISWGTLGGLMHRARWESALPMGFQALEGMVDSPWSLQGMRRQGRLRVTEPPCLRGVEIPITLPQEGIEAPPPGTPVRFRGELRAVDPAPTFIAERPLWRARSDDAPRRVHLRSAQLMEVLGPPRPSWVLRLQVFVRTRFDALPLPQGTARDLWGALTLGIPPAKEEVFSVFAESGTIHTLVVSGLQVTLVMVCAEALWRRTIKRGSALACGMTGLLYCLAVGFSAPVWRGLLMGLAWALGRNSGWRLPPVVTLHGALLAWLMTHPAAGCEPGFLLAWFALLGLLWVAEPLAGVFSPLLGKAALPLARFLAPWLTTLPLLALLHGGAPIWGVIANLFLLPLVALLTPICLVLTLVPVAPLVQGVGWLLAWTGEQGVPFFARVIPLATAYLSPWILLSLGWIWLAQRHAAMRRTRALCLVLTLSTLLLIVTRGLGRSANTLSLEAMDIGQGDAMLLRVPEGDATVIDTGPSPWAARRIARVLSRRGVREPVHLVISHPHGDHAGGWATLARLWPLASVSVPDSALPKEAWTAVATDASLKSARRCLRGDVWKRGEAEFSVRWPPKPFALPDANMISLVLRVRWRDRELWLMGDALAIQERDLMDLGDPGELAAHRLLKSGHHGSANASDPAWIRSLRPEVAILTAGRRNAFDFPHDVTLDTLKKEGCESVWNVGARFGVRAEAVPGDWRVDTGEGLAASR